MAEWMCEHKVWHSEFDRMEPCPECKAAKTAFFDAIMVPKAVTPAGYVLAPEHQERHLYVPTLDTELG